MAISCHHHQPPIYSAIKKNGKKLYQQARAGVSAEDIQIDPRQVTIYSCQLLNPEDAVLPKFEIGTSVFSWVMRVRM